MSKLSDLLHEVPRLWSGKCPQALWSTSRALRKQAQEHVTHITYGHRACLSDVRWLFKSQWNQLHSLHPEVTPEEVAQLGNAAWPLLTSLSLVNSCGRQNAPAAFAGLNIASFKGKWPLLKYLKIVRFGKLTQTQVTALVEVSWTSLKSLHIEVWDSAVPQLLHGNWPELTELCLGGGLSDQGFAHLSACPWSVLVRLRLTKLQALSQAYLPKLEMLYFDNARQGNGIDWVRGCFALTVHSWPQLASDFLSNDLDADNTTYSADMDKVLFCKWLQVRASAKIMQRYPKVWPKSLMSIFDLDIVVLLAIGLRLHKDECGHLMQAKVTFLPSQPMCEPSYKV